MKDKQNKNDPNAHVDFLIVVPQQLWDSYYFALGKFMHRFGRAEDALNATVTNFVTQRVQARYPKDFVLLRAVMGGQRIAALLDSLNRLLRVTSAAQTQKDEIARTIAGPSEMVGALTRDETAT